MSANDSSSVPFFQTGNFAPVEQEVTAFDLKVKGELPRELNGLYLRNGPNPRTPTGHWFFGDGMLHGIRLEDGHARWYRNRWVRTRSFVEGVDFIGPDGTLDRTIGRANTNVIGHAGKIFALVESSFPTEMSPELDTLGVRDYDGKLTSAMTAHPKICPLTGELHFFGYGFFPPFLVYNRADKSGRLVESVEIDVPGPTMMHDFAITENYVLFFDLPVVFDLEMAMGGSMPYRWSDEYGARIGVMRRGAASAGVRWFEIPPCYLFHPFNACEKNGTIEVDAARYDELWRRHSNEFAEARAHRWTIDLASGTVKERPLDDRAIEFPRVDDRLNGLPHRFGYAVSNHAGVSERAMRLLKYDFERGTTVAHDFGPGRSPGEGVFVPASPESAEDHGYVLAYVYDQARNGSDFVVLDARNFDAEPLAVIELPQRVPFGFHGNWIA